MYGEGQVAPDGDLHGLTGQADTSKIFIHVVSLSSGRGVAAGGLHVGAAALPSLERHLHDFTQNLLRNPNHAFGPTSRLRVRTLAGGRGGSRTAAPTRDAARAELRRIPPAALEHLAAAPETLVSATPGPGQSAHQMAEMVHDKLDARDRQAGHSALLIVRGDPAAPFRCEPVGRPSPGTEQAARILRAEPWRTELLLDFAAFVSYGAYHRHRGNPHLAWLTEALNEHLPSATDLRTL
ncbi:hypothetical protein [Streptomyces sp. NPDC059593]|uniref:hypothetical protein n=1 Tax=Streptomyces sp. NPDC059593 TaxID=3346878 RepID=UPI00367A93BB